MAIATDGSRWSNFVLFAGLDLDMVKGRDYVTERYGLTDAGSMARDLPPLTTYQRRGSLQLWQFLIALLENPANTSFIAWTGRGLEFKLIEPEEVSKLTYAPRFLFSS